MIIKCPSCGKLGEFRGEIKKNILCQKCGSSFHPEGNAFPDDPSERVWKIRGDKGLPVSLKVISYKVKTGALSINDGISCDGRTWFEIGQYPPFRKLTEKEPKGKRPEERKTFERDRLHQHDPPRKAEAPSGAMKVHHTVERSHLKLAIVVTSLIWITIGVAYLLLSKNIENLALRSRNLKLENTELKANLSAAERKISQLEENLTGIINEFDRVKSSSEEFRQTKAILEDIKKSIDSHKIYLVISLEENRLYVKIGTKTLKSYVVSTGKGETVLKTTGKPYNFLTPRGKMIIKSRQKNPVWVRPDWVWLEKGLPIPENITIEDRSVEGELGKYRLNLGDGYAIHGTKSGEVNGEKETHGCVRRGREDLKELFNMVKTSTEVYIY